MTLDDRARAALQEALDRTLGDENADTLMGYLPPVGWADVATKRDLDALSVVTRKDLENASALLRIEFHTEFAAVRQEMGSEFAAVRQEMGSEFAAVRREIAVLEVEFERALRKLTVWLMSAVFGCTGVLFAAIQATG